MNCTSTSIGYCSVSIVTSSYSSISRSGIQYYHSVYSVLQFGPSTFWAVLPSRPVWNMTVHFWWVQRERKKNKFLRIFALALFIVQSIIDICYKGQLRSYQMSHLEWLITLGKSRPVWPEAFLHSCPYLSFHNVENHTRPTSSETEQRFYYVVMTSFYIIT